MPRYHVTLEGRLSETWTVDADSPEAAIEAVRDGKGRWIYQRWDGEPAASVREQEVPPGPDSQP